MKIQVSGPMPNARVAPIPPLHLVRSASAKVDFYSGGQEGGAPATQDGEAIGAPPGRARTRGIKGSTT